LNEIAYGMMLEELDEKKRRWGVKPPKLKPRLERRFDRVIRIKIEHPGCTFTFCRVDTENRFEFDGVWFRINDSVAAYQPKQTKEGVLYDMDAICVVRDVDGELHFYDQRMHVLDQENVLYA
jgi:hypothetical protein